MMDMVLRNMLCWFCGNKYQRESPDWLTVTISAVCDRCFNDKLPSGTKVIYGAYNRDFPEKTDQFLERDKIYTIKVILHGCKWIDVFLEESGDVCHNYYLFLPADFDLSLRVCAITDNEFATSENMEWLKRLGLCQ